MLSHLLQHFVFNGWKVTMSVWEGEVWVFREVELYTTVSDDTKYFISETGMQISLVTPSDAGFYHCVVTNEFTGQTRKSPKPVLIIVSLVCLSLYSKF